ncbi:uncharacterized protein CANTADRAFT_26978 [Suhomyces tanzawaensis NRRL Y-17324]|uniref:GYF domain-containing protein n=1 Tax=Suhomyces tanzawaensis NRRL Y-17324 TaxID=984487 RepID=A0A1E4SES6_9ASCO|nr:uncharacterized protein CANTADRAFT_26978 [Suhomyces tanzawaensis NRRL Y-17324]ODV78024.1 hypothetical protein CANTADRAFT_26978 [Suhomyces tanzawaensis NRRL Y-17324]
MFKTRKEMNGEDYGATIPLNRGGQRYTINEVFDVWYQNQSQILAADVELPVKNGENYKLTRPREIYHLELAPRGLDENGTAANEMASVEDSLASTALDDSSMASQQPESTPVAQTLTAAPLPTLPPGLAPPTMESPSNVPLLTPDKIEWYYIDPLGTEQGPFNGDLMQEWLTGGYLDLELRIRRKEERNYKPLKQLCEAVQNYIQPFKVPLPDLNHQPALPQFISHHPLPQQTQLHQILSHGPGNLGSASMRLNQLGSQTNLFGNDFINPDPFAVSAPGSSAYPNPSGFGNMDPMHQNLGFPLNMPTLLQQQIQHQQHAQPGLSRNNSGWGLDGANGLMGGSSPGTPVSVNPVLSGQINQPTPISPWLTGVQSLSRVNSPFVPSSTITKESSEPHTDDHVLDGIHSSVVTDILGDVEEAKIPVVAEQAPAVPEPVAETVEESIPEPATEAPAPAPAPVEIEQEQPVEVEEAEKIEIAESLKPAVPSQQELAPWASSAATNSPALTLKEIQALEAEKMEKQRQIQLQLKEQQMQQAAVLKQFAVEDKPVEKPFLPKSSSWATNAPSTPTKTLAEIQREEAEAAKAKSVKTKVSVSSARPSSFASALANSVPEENSAWTTVTAKKPVAKKPTASQILTPSVPTKTNPQLLRSVSAQRPVSSVNNNAVREEFLIWARSSMTNLYPTVSKDDLLDIFITLPASSADSSSLIAETIYSSSATMDGRRFAQEFLKRRQKVDQQIGKNDEGAWSAAIASSADKSVTVDEDGWSTTVKSKKKGKKF